MRKEKGIMEMLGYNELKDLLTDVINAREGIRDGSKKAVMLDEKYLELTDRIGKIDVILKDIKLNEKSFEPVDSEGYAYEGLFTYKGEEKGGYFSAYSNDSYEEQAAMQVFQELYGDMEQEEERE